MQSMIDSVTARIGAYRRVLRIIQKDDFQDLYEGSEQETRTQMDICIYKGWPNRLRKYLREQQCLNLWPIRRLRILAKRLHVERYYSLQKDRLLVRIKERIDEQNGDDYKHYLVV